MNKKDGCPPGRKAIGNLCVKIEDLKAGKPILKWDTAERSEELVKEIMKNPDEWGYEGRLTEDDIREHINQDGGMLESELDMDWECLGNDLTSVMDDKTKRNAYPGWWKGRVENFGWRNQSGSAVIQAETGEQLLGKVLPDTQCKFHIFNNGRGIKIRNWHHDSPMGNEMYYLQPMTKKEVEEHRGF